MADASPADWGVTKEPRGTTYGGEAARLDHPALVATALDRRRTEVACSPAGLVKGAITCCDTRRLLVQRPEGRSRPAAGTEALPVAYIGIGGDGATTTASRPAPRHYSRDRKIGRER